MNEGITVSKKFGLNPSITHCQCCGKEIGIALFGADYRDPKTKKTIEAPKDVYMGYCDDCKKVMDDGGMLIIEVEDGARGNNPKRTGRIVGITKDARERAFKDEKSPIVYMEESVFSPMFGEFCKPQESCKPNED